MPEFDKSKPIMVTGATGYVAGWLVKKLLEEGFTVHAPIRDPDNKEKLKHLDKLVANGYGKIKCFKANLLQDGSYAQAMEGCSTVFHTASPFISNFKDAQRELIDPALLGTRNVLLQANKTPSVQRVVLTSSCAAIYGDNSDLETIPNKILTEAIWNTSSSLEHQPYSYSKTLAEKEAWTIFEKQNQWQLVVLNPSLVIGPGLNPRGTSESFNIIKQFGDGTMRTGAPRLSFGVVDVRDLAQAHFVAGFKPDASGRHIISAHNTNLLEMAEKLMPKYGKSYPLPRWPLPKALVWLVGPTLNPGLTRKVVAKNIGIAWKADNSKSISELGMSYRSLYESMNNFFEQMVQNDYFKHS